MTSDQIHAVELAKCYLAGGDSPPLSENTTKKLAEALIELADEVTNGRDLQAIGALQREVRDTRHRIAELEAKNVRLKRERQMYKEQSFPMRMLGVMGPGGMQRNLADCECPQGPKFQEHGGWCPARKEK